MTVAVWVGYPHGVKAMTKNFGGKPVYGGTFPAQIWKTYMENAMTTSSDRAHGEPGIATSASGSSLLEHRLLGLLRDGGLHRRRHDGDLDGAREPDRRDDLAQTGATTTGGAATQSTASNGPTVTGGGGSTVPEQRLDDDGRRTTTPATTTPATTTRRPRRRARAPAAA